MYKLLSSTCLGFTTSHLPKMLSISLKFFGISSVSLSVSLSSSSPPFPYPVVLSLSLTVLYFLGQVCHFIFVLLGRFLALDVLLSAPFL